MSESEDSEHRPNGTDGRVSQEGLGTRFSDETLGIDDEWARASWRALEEWAKDNPY